jgi:hypothetical protein
MDLTQIAETLKSLSPFMAILVLVGALAFRWFEYREKKDAAQAEADASKRSQEDHDNLLELMQKVEDTAEGQKTVQGLLVTHSDSADLRFQQELDIFKQILRQLISLNATATDGISTDNAKLIVQYQWNWCRNETSRVIQNSIRNNHFRGDEERVARSVFRAWHRAAVESLSSVMRLRGVTYPYQALYTHHITLIWELVWDWAVAVYYTSRDSDAELEASLKDLDGLISSLFDQVFETHVELVEDVDAGALYDDSRDSRPTVVPNDITRPAAMAYKLSSYKASEHAGDATVHFMSPIVLRERMGQHLAERHAKPYQKIRSSAEIPAPP